MGSVLVGTSGFSYDDWKGHFYPEGIKKGDMLAYYAERFAAVEVNSTFYVIPGAASFESMARRTPEGFDFTIKAYKELTHNPDADPAVFEQFAAALTPLKDAGKLGCVLAQYPWSFKKTAANMDKLRRLSDSFGDIPVVVEFRNSGWVGEDTLGLLKESRLGFCCVDEPRLKGLMPRAAVVTSPVGYVRFHGRNAAKWWQHEHAWERYDYLYSREELAEWLPQVEFVSSTAEKTYLFFNNHYKGQAAQNAAMFAEMLGEE